MADTLRQLVALGKGSRSGGANERADFLKARLRKAGFDVELDNVPLPQKENGTEATVARNLVAVREAKNAPTILLFGHLDTVEAGEGWSTDPFTVVEKGNKLYGRGTLDMLSGVTAFIEALERPSKYGIVLLGACDEEEGSAGTADFVARRKDLLRKADLVLSGDATDMFPENAKPGQLPHSIMVGNPGYGCAEVVLKPKSRDAGELNPLEVLDVVLTELKAIVKALPNRSKSRLLKDEAGMSDISADSPEGAYFPKSITVSVDIYVGLEPTLARLESIRAEMEAKLLKAPAIKSITRRGFELRFVFGNNPVPPTEGFLVSDLSSPLLRLLTTTIKNVVGVRQIRKVGGEFIGDENILAAGLSELGRRVPIIGYTAAGGNTHEANEYVCIPSFMQVREVYRRFLTG